MKSTRQTLPQLLDKLSLLSVDWQDETSRRVIQAFSHLPVKAEYEPSDIKALLDSNFEDGILIARLFLGFSKDQMTGALLESLGSGGVGVKRYNSDKDEFLSALQNLGLAEMMSQIVNYQPVWSDILVERLRSGRGSAITGQRRGKQLEDFVESIVREVFGSKFDTRCNFVGQRNLVAKCDVAIPSKDDPRIVIETKAYGATGSKMTDILGDIGKIIAAKRHDMTFILVTDGLTWKQRTSDLAKIVEHQNHGEILKIYTRSMQDDLRKDLQLLKSEQRL